MSVEPASHSVRTDMSVAMFMKMVEKQDASAVIGRRWTV